MQGIKGKSEKIKAEHLCRIRFKKPRIKDGFHLWICPDVSPLPSFSVPGFMIFPSGNRTSILKGGGGFEAFWTGSDQKVFIS